MIKLSEKIRTKYGFCLWTISICYVLSFVLSNWWTAKSVCLMYAQVEGMSFYIGSFWGVLTVTLISGILSLLIVRLIAGLYINIARLYMVPRQEFILISTLFVGFYHLVLGILSLTYLISPVISVWGGLVYDIMAFTAAGILFCLFVRKTYLSSQSAPFFVRSCIIIYCVYCALKVVMCI